MTNDYAVNDYVRYATNGVCKIDAVKTMDASGSREPELYYVLTPVGNPSATLYVPAENELLTAKISHVLSKDDLDALIVSSAETMLDWPEDRKARNEFFRDILRRCDQRELLKLVSCIYLKKCELAAADGKLSATDEGVLKQAEKLIQNDFAFVLGIDENEVGAYIRTLLEVDHPKR